MAIPRGAVASSVALCLVPLAGASAEPGTWQLVWSDEFEGDALDTSVWEAQIGTGTSYGLPAGWGNGEWQYYTDRPENVRVEDGWLTITAIREWYEGWQFTSARLRTQGAFEANYGRIEALIQVPSASGVWPAFWMLPTDSPYGGWAAGGEIDIMESVNIADTIYGTLHFGGPWPENTYTGGTFSAGGDVSIAPLRFAIEWEPYEIRWYVEDTLYSTKSYTSGTARRAGRTSLRRSMRTSICC